MNLSLQPITTAALPGQLETKGFSLPAMQQALALQPTIASGAAAQVLSNSFNLPLGSSPANSAPAVGTTSSLNGHTDDQLRKVSKDFEAVFMRLIFKEMRSSIQKSSLMGNSRAMDFFETMRDEQMAESLSSAGGLGIGNMIYQKLKEATLPHEKSFS